MITKPNVKLDMLGCLLYEVTLQGQGWTVPLRDGDDVQGQSHTFSAFATPSGTNLHNTVADSNHRLASLNWVALQDHERGRKSSNHEADYNLWSDTDSEETNTPIVGWTPRIQPMKGRERLDESGKMMYELQAFYTGVVCRPQ